MRRELIARTSFLFVTAALIIGAYATVPASAQADTVACGTPTIGNFVPHIYNGHLDSFDYYVDNMNGTSYLPVSTTIDGVSVDLSYVSVWHAGYGPTREMVHVDVPDALSLASDVTIQVGTLQITNGPPPLCVSQGEFHVKLAQSYVPPVNTTPISTNPSQYPADTSSQAPATTTTSPITTPASSSTTSVSTSTPTTTPVLSTTSECRTLALGWLILLALLDIIVSAALLLYMSFIANSNWRLTAAVLLPPIIFIGLWYFLDTCHGDVWFPILSVILAIIVLTASGSPDYFEGYRVKVMQFFGQQTKNTQMKLREATSIMEVK